MLSPKFGPKKKKKQERIGASFELGMCENNEGSARPLYHQSTLIVMQLVSHKLYIYVISVFLTYIAELLFF